MLPSALHKNLLTGVHLSSLFAFTLLCSRSTSADDLWAKIAFVRKDAQVRLAEVEQQRRELVAQRSSAQRQLSELQQVRTWAFGEFEDARSPARRYEEVSDQLERWRKAYQIAAHQLVEFPAEYSRGSIASGKALNFFLDALGQSSLQHDLLMRKYQDVDREKLSGTQYLLVTFLEDMEAMNSLPSDLLQEISCEQGLTGPRLPLRLTAIMGGKASLDPLPLEWPSHFLMKPQYESLVNDLEQAKALAWDELKQDQIGPGFRRLMNAVDELEREFNREFTAATQRKFHRADLSAQRLPGQSQRSSPVGDSDFQLITARNFVEFLRLGICRWAETRRLFARDFIGRNEDGTFSTVELVAFMKQNGLRFSRSTLTGETAYRLLFEKLAHYYGELVVQQAVWDELFSEREQAARKKWSQKIADVEAVNQEIRDLMQEQRQQAVKVALDQRANEKQPVPLHVAQNWRRAMVAVDQAAAPNELGQ